MLEKKTSNEIFEEIQKENEMWKNHQQTITELIKEINKVWVSQESLKELCEAYSYDKISWVKFLEEVGFDIKELKGEKE